MAKQLIANIDIAKQLGRSMQLQTNKTTIISASPKLSLARTGAEVREVQRLRYKVFVESGGLNSLANPQRLDVDEFDAYCDHLLVRDSASLKVVGTYRLLGPNAASDAG